MTAPLGARGARGPAFDATGETPNLAWFLPRVMPHYAQGELDGLCGLCCLAMVVDYLGVAAPDSLSDGRTCFPRFVKETFGTDVFLRTGSTADQLISASGYFGKKNEDLRNRPF